MRNLAPEFGPRSKPFQHGVALRRLAREQDRTIVPMTAPTMKIEPLGEHPDLVTLTCEWHLAEFDPEGDMDFWLRARTEEARHDGLPCAWVAFADGEPVGSVSLVECNMDTRKDLTPWLAALFVLPEHRGRGIGAALVERCEREAALTGAIRLYLYTERAANYYKRLGWAVVSEETYEEERVTVMAKELPSSELH